MSYVQYSYADQSNSAEEVQKELAGSNHFSLRELEENRQGRISSLQLFKLLGAIASPIAGPGMAMLGWFALLAVVYVLSPFIPFGRKLLMKYLWPVLGITAGGVLVLVIGLLQTFDKLVQVLADIASGKCATAQGRVSASKAEDTGEGIQQVFGGKISTYGYVLQGQHYPVGHDAYEALLPHSGGVFKLHFAPRSKVLLSIEPV